MSLGKAGVHARRQTLAHAAPETHTEEGLRLVTKTHAMQTPVLVLNASYEPINICGARRALVLVLKGIARTEEEHGLTLHAQRTLIAMPSVIRLLEYRRIPHQTRALSRKNILLREPRPFSLHTSRQIMRMLGRGDDRWRKYLFY